MEEQRDIFTVTPPGETVGNRQVDSDFDEVDKEESEPRNKFSLLAPPSVTSHEELKAILQIESNHYTPPRNYLAFDSCKCGVNENWRRRLCEWMFEVTDHYDFDREVVSYAFDYLDRSVSLTYGSTSQKRLSKRDYQLYAVTSLYLAIKVHGEMDTDGHGKRIKLRISAFQELSRGCFKTATIEAKELEFLILFQWRVNPPTCARCIYLYLQLFPDWMATEFETPREDIVCQIFDVAKYLTELSILVSDFSFNYSPSTIAYGAILCAIDYVEESIKRIPYLIKVRLLQNIKGISSKLTPESKDIRLLGKMIKKLAPQMFTNDTWSHPFPRTMSLLDVDPAQSAAKESRSILPIVMGSDKPERKRQRV